MVSSAPVQPAIGRDGKRCCPECARTDAKAGALWGCKSCKTNYDASYRWWSILGAGGCHGDDDE